MLGRKFIFYKIILIGFCTAFLPIVVLAQPGLPGAPSQAPIDGGLSILAAAGGAYAIKKLRDKKDVRKTKL